MCKLTFEVYAKIMKRDDLDIYTRNSLFKAVCTANEDELIKYINVLDMKYKFVLKDDFKPKDLFNTLETLHEKNTLRFINRLTKEKLENYILNNPTIFKEFQKILTTEQKKEKKLTFKQFSKIIDRYDSYIINIEFDNLRNTQNENDEDIIDFPLSFELLYPTVQLKFMRGDVLVNDFFRESNLIEDFGIEKEFFMYKFLDNAIKSKKENLNMKKEEHNANNSYRFFIPRTFYGYIIPDSDNTANCLYIGFSSIDDNVFTFGTFNHDEVLNEAKKHICYILTK